ncbi:MAG: hypothetical protein HY647_11745 [Acidobacteria bacterium]|nr:hypothetical protein [Acidobacteriota bacterium]
MQTLVQVLCRKGPSLRDRIVNDSRISNFKLAVRWEKKPGRKRGWAKIRGTEGQYGAINIEWDGRTKTLICRVITKGFGKPHSIIGDFVDYLLARFRRTIRIINILES